MTDAKVLSTTKDSIRWITINRPKVGNSIDMETYRLLIAAVHAAATDDNVKAAVLTGTGKFFSTGADVAPNLGITGALYYLAGRLGHYLASELRDTSVALTSACLAFPKPLICALNGPVVGWSAAVLGCFDIVIVAESATLATPFMDLGLVPEGLSSVTFPQVLGPSLANDVLVFGRKITAQEMLACGFASRVLPDAGFQDAVHGLLASRSVTFSSLGSLTGAKRLLRPIQEVAALEKVNHFELKVIGDRFKSGDPVKKFQEKAAALRSKKREKEKKGAAAMKSKL